METDLLARVPDILRPALQKRGFTQLTAVQEAILSSEHAGKDLRISSQTGSGKTVAMGILLHDQLDRAEGTRGICHPRVIIITPTRELTAQVASELAWLLKDVKARVLSVTGGTSVRGEQRDLALGAEILVGTPGRMLDHLKQGVIDTSSLRAVLLDEADQMLDLGFRDELEAILEKLPADRRTHLVSATFSSDVLHLARRYQKDAIHVQGTSLGTANVDIQHVIHLVSTRQTTDAVINLLLCAPDELTLIFVRTRAEAGELAQRLTAQGFSAAALTGEMEQAARTRVMTSFRAGHLRTLVATDVAARGIDVPDVSRVIQADPPKDAEVYTHRSGRTGRAGRKGTSIILVPAQARERVTRLLQRSRIPFEVKPVPGAAEIIAASDERLLADLSAPSPVVGDDAWNPHLHSLAEKLLEQVEPVVLVHRLLARVGHHGPCAPRSLDTPSAAAPRVTRDPSEPRAPRREGPGSWVTFRFTSGSRFGMDPRRLLATVCRRGNIRGTQVGSIKIGAVVSTFDVAAEVAEQFASSASQRDPRDPKVVIEPVGSSSVTTETRSPPRAAPEYKRAEAPVRTEAPVEPKRAEAPVPREEAPVVHKEKKPDVVARKTERAEPVVHKEPKRAEAPASKGPKRPEPPAHKEPARAEAPASKEHKRPEPPAHKEPARAEPPMRREPVRAEPPMRRDSKAPPSKPAPDRSKAVNIKDMQEWIAAEEAAPDVEEAESAAPPPHRPFNKRGDRPVPVREEKPPQFDRRKGGWESRPTGKPGEKPKGAWQPKGKPAGKPASARDEHPRTADKRPPPRDERPAPKRPPAREESAYKKPTRPDARHPGPAAPSDGGARRPQRRPPRP